VTYCGASRAGLCGPERVLDMATFDDDANPFRTDVDGDGTPVPRAPSPDSGDMSFRVVDEEEQTGGEEFTTEQPQPQPGLPPLPAKASSFPTSSQNWAQQYIQREECGCARDRYLHEDDAEILVCYTYGRHLARSS